MGNVVIACRPVDWGHMARAIGVQTEATPIYEGSEEHPCSVCAEPCYVGPRQLLALDVDDGAFVLCFACVFLAQQLGPEGTEVVIRDLGNPNV